MHKELFTKHITYNYNDKYYLQMAKWTTQQIGFPVLHYKAKLISGQQRLQETFTQNCCLIPIICWKTV